MSKRLFALLITLAFLSGLAIVQPHSIAVSQISVTEFQEEHITPVVDLSANFYEPTLRTSFNKTFRITFPELALKITKITVGQSVNSEINTKAGDHLLGDINTVECKRVRNWLGGATTYETTDPSKVEYFLETGFFYEGWIPSAQQLADYIAYLNGWELNYIYEADRQYAFGTDSKPCDYIIEEEIPNMPVNSSYENGQITIVQDLTKASVEIFNKTTADFTIGLQISDITPGKIIGIDDLIAAIIISVIVGAIVGWAAFTATDNTPFSQEDLEAAHKLGYGKGANETLDYMREQFMKMFYNRTIDNSTYIYLSYLLDNAYPEIMKRYVNPYEGLNTKDSGDWFHTIISVLEQVFIIAIIVIVVIIVIWLIRKTGIFSSSKGSSGATTNIFPSSTRATELLKTIFLQGLSTGWI